MIHSYKISGMTCKGCAEIVSNSLSKVIGVKSVKVNLAEDQANIETEHPVLIEALKAALEDTLYQISETTPEAKQAAQLRAEKEALGQKKQLVAQYVAAVGQLNYAQLRECLHKDFEFDGGVKTTSAEAYIEMAKEHAAYSKEVVVIQNDIKAIFADGNESVVIYEMVTNKPIDPIPIVQWITFEEARIKSAKLKFERPGMRQLMDEVKKEKVKQ